MTVEEVCRIYAVPPWIMGYGKRPAWWRRPIYRFGWWRRVRREDRRCLGR